ncbi:MAG: SUMF1/EgtB/PvdO family nonheme iron enzyme [Methyloligellaceae bacterium]
MTPPAKASKNPDTATRNNPETAFSRAVLYYRRQTECTQEEFAEACDISLTTVQDIEAGRVKRPRQDTIKKIVIGLQSLGVDIDLDRFDEKFEFFKTAQIHTPQKTSYVEPEYTQEDSKGREDLTCVLQHIGVARHFVEELGKRTNSEQRFVETAVEIFDYFEILGRESFDLDDFCDVIRQFDCLAQEAARRELNSIGSLVSLNDLRDKLRGFKQKVESFYNPYDGLVRNGTPYIEVKHQQLIRELELEIEDRKNKLDRIPDREIQTQARKILMKLKIELGLDPLNLTKIDAIRQRLDALDRDIFRDIILKCQLILGKHAEKLPHGTVFRDAEYTPEMVVIPSCEEGFLMGSPADHKYNREDYREDPQRTVCLAYRFAVGRMPVTFYDWDQCLANSGTSYNPGDEGWGRESRPVINVSWDDAQDYVRWLSKITGETYRLLSEAEWEYSCRSGSDAEFCFGDDEKQLNDYGWSDENAGEQTHPVGQKKSNIFGLFDMHGNVWEWCEDVWHNGYEGAPTDGSARLKGGDEDEIRRVLRGGSWLNYPQYLRARNRYGDSRVNRNGGYGFRVARALASSQAR